MKDLFKLHNVVLVGRGHKIIGGNDTGREAVVVGVTKKLPLTQLTKAQLIPSHYDGKETDVIEVGVIKAQRTDKHRPSPGGVSIGHYLVSAGTLGMVARKQGKRVILSNAHVLNNVNKGEIGDPVLQPGVYDGGTILDRIGYVLQSIPIEFPGESNCPLGRAASWVFNVLAKLFKRKTRLIPSIAGINLVDCAIAMPDNGEDVLDEILEIGKPTGFDTVDVGERVKKSGRSGLSYGEVIVMDSIVRVDYDTEGIATFIEQIITTCMSEPGDSGSIVLNDDDAVIGLLFAGSDTITIINKINNVIAALELDG